MLKIRTNKQVSGGDQWRHRRGNFTSLENRIRIGMVAWLNLSSVYASKLEPKEEGEGGVWHPLSWKFRHIIHVPLTKRNDNVESRIRYVWIFYSLAYQFKLSLFLREIFATIKRVYYVRGMEVLEYERRRRVETGVYDILYEYYNKPVLCCGKSIYLTFLFDCHLTG